MGIYMWIYRVFDVHSYNGVYLYVSIDVNVYLTGVKSGVFLWDACAVSVFASRALSEVRFIC